MKNNSPNKNAGTAISVILALAAAILFWLVVKAIDAGVIGATVTAFVSDVGFYGFL